MSSNAAATLRWRNPLSRLSGNARLTVLALGALYGSIILLVLIIGPANIFRYIIQLAQWLALQPHGRLIVVGLIALCSFPPMVGYSNAITLCGLAFGSKAGATPTSPQGGTVLQGYALAVAGAMLGSSLAFMVLRLVNRSWRKAAWLREIKESRQWMAMSRAVRERGFTMTLLIRCCPFPFVYSNLFFASLDTVSFTSFFLATLLSTPRLLLHVYVGSIMYDLLDENLRAQLPPHVKVLDGISIVAGIGLGAGVGWYLYRQMNQILELEAHEEEEREGLAQSHHAAQQGLAGPARLPGARADSWRSRQVLLSEEA